MTTASPPSAPEGTPLLLHPELLTADPMVIGVRMELERLDRMTSAAPSPAP